MSKSRKVEGLLASPTRNIWLALIFVACVALLATVAYLAAGWSLGDAAYMVTITLFTVGYGETQPVDTFYLRAVTMTTMVLGCTGMILLTSVLVQYLTGLQIRRLLGQDRMKNAIDELSGHAVICGFGRIGQMLARDLGAGKYPLVIVELSGERLAEARAAGHLCIQGDATDEQLLLAAGIERARVLATVLHDDAANVFITLSARSLNAQIEIISRGEQASTERKMRHAGADRIILPAYAAAERIAHMILHPGGEALQSDDHLGEVARGVGQLGLVMERATVAADSVAAGLDVDAVERRAEGSMFIIQVERDHQPPLRQPPRDFVLQPGDSILVVARESVPHALFAVRQLRTATGA